MSKYNPVVINWAGRAKPVGLSFLIVNLGVPWALRPNSSVLLRSCPKRVLFLFFRRELPHKTFHVEDATRTKHMLSCGSTGKFYFLSLLVNQLAPTIQCVFHGYNKVHGANEALKKLWFALLSCLEQGAPSQFFSTAADLLQVIIATTHSLGITWTGALLPRIQLCSLRRLNWLLLPYDYCHYYFLVSSMLKLSSLKPSK